MSNNSHHRDHIWSSTYSTMLAKLGDVDQAAALADRAVARFCGQPVADLPAAGEIVDIPAEAKLLGKD